VESSECSAKTKRKEKKNWVTGGGAAVAVGVAVVVADSRGGEQVSNPGALAGATYVRYVS